MFVFPSQQRAGTLILVLDVFPFAGVSALFSDAVDYRFRLRSATIKADANRPVFALGSNEYALSCRFSIPTPRDGDPALIQDGTCTSSMGHGARFQVNDESGGSGPGLRVFAGVRMDPFFFDGVKALQTLVTRKLSFEERGTSTMFRQNVLSIVIELDVPAVFGADAGPMLAIVGETITAGSLRLRLERFGRADVKNLLILPKDFDTINRDVELRDVYNDGDAFNLGPAYRTALRARMNANLLFWDGLDGKTDWTPDKDGIHPLLDLFLDDFMVVDMSKPYVADSYLEIERSAVKGVPNQTCGGRSLNDDAVDTFLTFMINGGNGPRISDGVDCATILASQTFPYLALPEPNPPQPRAPAIVSD